METLVSMEIWAVGAFRDPQNPVHKAPLTSLDQSRVSRLGDLVTQIIPPFVNALSTQPYFQGATTSP
jgi:hypothetical protein